MINQYLPKYLKLRKVEDPTSKNPKFVEVGYVNSLEDICICNDTKIGDVVYSKGTSLSVILNGISGQSGVTSCKIDSISVNGEVQAIDSNKNVDLYQPTKLSEFVDDETHRLVTDAEKDNWNNSTKQNISIRSDISLPSTITFDKDNQVVNYTSLEVSTFTGLNFESDINEDGVYTWELMLSSNQDITSSTYNSNVQYVGNDKSYNPDLGFALIDNERTTHVFTIRLIRKNSTNTWMFAYNYSFKG